MWKPQAMYLMAEYYLSKKQKQKSKDFFNQIINIENISPKIKLEVQKRLRLEFSELKISIYFCAISLSIICLYPKLTV